MTTRGLPRKRESPRRIYLYDVVGIVDEDESRVPGNHQQPVESYQNTPEVLDHRNAVILNQKMRQWVAIYWTGYAGLWAFEEPNILHGKPPLVVGAPHLF